MPFTVMGEGQQQRVCRRRAAYVAWLPLILCIISVVTTSIWYYYASLALLDTRAISALISIPAPAAFSKYLPAILAASLAFVIVQAVLLCAVYTWRSVQQFKSDRNECFGDNGTKAPTLLRRGPLAVASAILCILQYLLVVWFVFMLAITMLWYGGGMVAAKATMDGATTMSVVDETMPRLIQNAMGIDPRKQGYLVHVGGRDVNIGTSTCSLFCFTLARAMLADTIDCTCNDALAAQLMPPGNVTADITDEVTCSAAPVMCSINALAFKMYKKHMKPAMICVVITTLCLVGLLSLLSGTHARVKTELLGSRFHRGSSTEPDLRISTGSDSDEPVKSDAKVAV